MRKFLPSLVAAVVAVLVAPSSASADPVAPSAPQNVVARAGVNDATVKWSAPADQGGSADLNYVVTASPSGRTCTAASSALNCAVTGLSNGQAYTFTVVATGDGPASEASVPSAAVTPKDDTQAPVLVSSTVTPSRVSSLGGTIYVELRITDDISGLRTPSGFLDANPAILFKDSAGTSFGFTRGSTRVAGDNYDGIYRYTVNVPSGTRAGSAKLTVYPIADTAGNRTFFTDRPGLVIGSPSAPVGVTATATPARNAQVSWAAPSDDGGNSITGYTITEAPSGRVLTTTGATTLEFPLTEHPADIPLTYSVAAINAGGTSPSASSAPLTIPANVPSAPAKPGVKSSNKQVAVSWFPSAPNGDAITAYTATASPGGATCGSDGAGRSCVIGGLDNGTDYTVDMTATNSAGTSEASPASDFVTPASAPETVSQPTATARRASAAVTWEPTTANGTPITGYTVTAAPGGQTCSTTASSTSCEVSGLANGTGYTFTVKATSAAGSSNTSTPSASVTPADVPSAPGKPTLTRANKQLTVKWPAAAANGATITRYTATASPAGASCTTTGTTCAISDLKNGTAYTVTVTATNSLGDSEKSAASDPVTPSAVPTQVAKPAATAGPARATIKWTRATANGSPVTGYTVTSAPGGKTCTATASATSCTVTGLTNGTNYTFTVTAKSAVGNAIKSVPTSTVKPVDKPASVSKPTAKTGKKSATISWRAPSANGSTITGYVILASNGKKVTVSASRRSAVVSGLTKGKKYTFKVAAKNAKGQGAYSSASSSITSK